MKHAFVWLTVLFTITAGVLLFSFQAPEALNSGSVRATYARGVLHVKIPYVAPREGVGTLLLDVLDPDDQILAQAKRQVEIAGAKGIWQADLPITKALPSDELIWHRLRYRFVFSGSKTAAIQGTDSISQILRMPVVHILGQRSYLTGAPGAVRVIVTDSKNEPIAGPGSLRVELAPTGQKPQVLSSGPLNRRGTTEAQFRFPSGLTGGYPLHFVVDTPIGSTEVTEQIRLQDKVSILLTTEKPIYQPGQTIHVRALALDRANHQAAAGRNLTFEVEDSRGNKVFKQETQTSKFGIASAEFALADEVNLGIYHLRAVLDAGAGTGSQTSELALNVEKYVLPKFKVAIDWGGADQKRHGYRPGDEVAGTVRANYFFGKPVAGAEVAMKASSLDVAVFDVASFEGKTGTDGLYHFAFKLPNYFAGRPLNQGAARVLVEATVKDSSSHSETRGEPITVSESPLIVTAVPEGGTLIPGLENQIFILTSYADGQPAVADVSVRSDGTAEQSVTTDAGGVAIIRLKPDSKGKPLQIEAQDKAGNRIATAVPLPIRPEQDQILLRTQHAIYHAGDRIGVRVLSTKARGTAYVDVLREGQTMLTRDLDIENGQAELTIPVTPDMAGTLDLNAYEFSSDATQVSDHRLVFVQPADELKIKTVTSASVYKPGEDARVSFRVTNNRGEGVQAALGVQVVDEAVFALAEKQPGFAKVFFYLEQEALKPRYEIHSVSMSDVFQPAAHASDAQRDQAARALFAASEVVNAQQFQTEVGRELPNDKYPAYFSRYEARFIAALRKAPARDLTKTVTLKLRDAWDTNVRVEEFPGGPAHTNYLIRSAGPDKRFDTGDDLEAYVAVQNRRVLDHAELLTFDVHIEHGYGALNGPATVVGTVQDQTGAAIPGATIELQKRLSNESLHATSNASGQVNLAGIRPGDYELRISSPGFRTASRHFNLAARDRAVVAIVLEVGALSESVVIEEAQPVRKFRMGGNMGINGIVGGVIGGVVGGVPAGMGGGVAFGRLARVGTGMIPPAPAMANLPLNGRADVPLQARVRSYFPEALYINPQILTDQNGLATISIPMADSITTWRMALMASNAHGALGSGTASLKVFQDFFVDLDLPVTLTQGDRVDIPVAAYNYTGAKADVSLRLQPDSWFSLQDDVPEKTVIVDPGQVGGSHFALEAMRIGKFKLTLSARIIGSPDQADIVVREIEVVPNGREQDQVFNGRLESSVHHDVSFPTASIPDASSILVRLYPGPLSQVIEGMDAILRMPGGCFEQTSSSTYPNVLALDYMKRTQKLAPEIHAKAEGFIANGYQRLLTFEVPGGGFSWFGNAPANKILTAYGLMEFSDMSKVHDVDARIMERTASWLASQQQADGSWKPDTSFINEGATNRYNSDLLRITSYIAWSLESTGYQGPAIEHAKQFLESHMSGTPDNYTLAVLANFAVDNGKGREFTDRVMRLLLDARTEKDQQAWWTAEETGVYATGQSAAVETTGLAAQALLKWGQDPSTTRKALSYLASKKDASGTWGTTQATIMALRALLLGTEKGTADVRGAVEIVINGKPVQSVTLTPENNDLLHQFVFKEVGANANSVDIRFSGKGSLAYQVVGRNFVPWSEKVPGEALSIGVAYDRTRLRQDDIATATASIKNNLPKTANMVMVDLGIPPGFDLLTEDLQDYQEKSASRRSGRLEKFNLTATQAILYFDSIAAGDAITLHYRLRAKYPIRARTFQSRVYEYYDPDVTALAAPQQLEILKRP